MASEEEIAVLLFIERTTQYLKEVYPNCNEELLDDLIELIDNVLQYYVLVIDDSSTTLFRSRRGRPEISINL